LKASTLRWLLAAFGVLVVSLTVATFGLRTVARKPPPGERAQLSPDSSRVRQKVSFRKSQWSGVLVDAATAAGVGVSELNSRPEAFSSATYTGESDRLLETLSELEKRGAPLKRAWFGPAVTGADSVTGFSLLVELERPDSRGR
jgi:hypothetical protein